MKTWLSRGDPARYNFLGLDADEVPVAIVIRGNADVYAFDRDLP